MASGTEVVFGYNVFAHFLFRYSAVLVLALLSYLGLTNGGNLEVSCGLLLNSTNLLKASHCQNEADPLRFLVNYQAYVNAGFLFRRPAGWLLQAIWFFYLYAT